MRVDYLCSYYSQWAHENIEPRTQALWDAFMFCRAVKNASINGKCTIPLKSGRQSITGDNIGFARVAFGYFVAQVYRQREYGTAPMVPAPSKDSFTTENFRSRTMLEEARSAKLHVPILPIARFQADLQPSAQGGPRGFAAMYPHIAIDPSIEPCSVVLVDDIVTTGGMLLAAHDRLTEAGFTVLGAIACGKTTSSREVAFAVRSFELTHEQGEVDLDALT